MSESKDQGPSHIYVAVRCRPLHKREKEVNDLKTIQIIESNSIILIDPTNKSKRLKQKKYTFDKVFGESSKQAEIFDETTSDLVYSVLEGYNSTIFAYGPTGAGKTHTMFGENERLGLIQLSIFDLFDKLSLKQDRKYTIQLSYIEIYNEVLRDLISPNSAVLDIREDPNKGVMISDLQEIEIFTPEQAVEMIKSGSRFRTVEPTEANSVSSRSHGIIMIGAEFVDKCSGVQGEIFSGKLFLIDLAGSERASHTKNKGMRLIEGANINRSLLALGNCINSLYEINSKGVKGYVPYRDSKLTRILKDSLGGKSKTAMITCVSPFVLYYDDTHNTLEYANRVKKIKTKVERNVVNVDYHVVKYKEIIGELRNEIKELKIMAGKRNQSEVASFVSGPDEALEQCLKEIEDHFALEYRTKMKSFETRKEVDSLYEDLVPKEYEYIAEGEGDGLRDLKNRIKAGELKYKRMQAELVILERKRKEFQYKWNDLSEDSLSRLKMNLQKHIIRINEYEKNQNKIHEENLVKRKDLYIEKLENKLKEKLNHLELSTNSPRSITKNNLSKVSNSSFPIVQIFTPKPRSYLEKSPKSNLLPPISPPNKHFTNLSKDSRIPRLQSRNNDNNSSESLLELKDKKVFSMIKGKSQIAKNKKTNLFVNNKEKTSLGGQEFISESKFKNSPFAKRKRILRD